MSIEENKALSLRVTEEIFNQGNLDLVDEIIDKNFIAHGSPEDTKGPEGLKQFASQFRSAFPDLKITTQDQIAEGDRVVIYYREDVTLICYRLQILDKILTIGY